MVDMANYDTMDVLATMNVERHGQTRSCSVKVPRENGYWLITTVFKTDGQAYHKIDEISHHNVYHRSFCKEENGNILGPVYDGINDRSIP